MQECWVVLETNEENSITNMSNTIFTNEKNAKIECKLQNDKEYTGKWLVEQFRLK